VSNPEVSPPAAAPVRPRLATVLRALAWVLMALTSLAVARSFVRGPRIGIDYRYFFPRLLDGEWWRMQNGYGAVQWFSPSFCGGVARAPDGQDLSFALPQLLSRWLDPRDAVVATAVIMALVGGAGFARLLRRGFGASPEVATLGAAVMAFNAAHEARALAGHLAYHGMMLVPWACLAIVDPLPSEAVARRWRLGGDVLLAGFTLAYIVSAGLLNLAVPLGLAVLAVALLQALHSGAAIERSLRDAALRLAAGSALALAFSAAKLAAFASYYGQFRRDFYPLPGADGFFEAIVMTARAVFGVWAPVGAHIANTQWTTEAHELTYGVGPLPALGMVLAALMWSRITPRPTLTTLQRVTLAGAVFALAIPFAVNVYTPTWNAFLKRLPILSSSSVLFRWWIAYVFVAPLGLLGFDRLAPRARNLAVIAGVALTLGVALVKGRPTEAANAYDPSRVLLAWHLSHDLGVAPPITTVSSARRNTLEDEGLLIEGASHQLCYEPTFGYRLERFPRGPLHLGPIDDTRFGVLNLKNPACYVWPRENRCAPGDHFQLNQRDAMMRFASRRPFAFAMSGRQRVANAVTLAALVGAVGLVVALIARRLKR
jgi:hypothetical protein